MLIFHKKIEHIFGVNREVMKIYGIIAEYNPFHRGHLYHMQQIDKSSDDLLVVVMSGSFVQRGEISPWDKWTRANWAMQAGADLVVELPTLCLLQSAEYFALGAIKLLKQLNCDCLSFGSETADLSQIDSLRKMINRNLEKDKLQRALKEGKSYPRALSDILGAPEILSKPNATLGLAYLQALSKISPNMEIALVQRAGAQYHDPQIEQDMPSASAIRAALQDGSIQKATHALPEFMQKSFSASPRANQKELENILFYVLRTSTVSSLKEIHGVDEGLENLLLKAAKSESYSSLINQLKSKRYTLLRLQRMLCKILLKADRNSIQFANQSELLPIHILALNEKTRPLLKSLQKKGMPIWGSHREFQALSADLQKIASFDCRASDLQTLCFHDATQRFAGKDFTHKLTMMLSSSSHA